MNLKNMFSFSLLLALPLLAAAQPGPPALPAPAAPPSGTPIPPRPARTTPLPNAAAAANNAAPATTNAAGAEPADIKYNLTMPVEQWLDDIYAPLVERTPLRAFTGGVNKDTMITLKTYSDLTKSEAIQALETVMGMNGITVVPIGDKFFKVVPAADASSAGGLSYSTPAAGLAPAGKFITEIVQLKYAKPEEVTEALGYLSKSPKAVIYIPSTQSLVLRDYTENVKRMLEMLEKLDVQSALTIKSKVIPIRFALASDIAAALSQLGAQGGASVGRSSSGASFSTGTGSTGSGTSGTSAGAFGQPQQTGSSSGASGRASNFATRLAGAVNGGGAAGGAGSVTLFGLTKIIADERTNSLLVFANDDDMKKIEDIIDKIDVVLAQVLIEAIILEVNLTDGKSSGVSFIQNQSTRGGVTGAGGNNVLSSGASSFLSGGGSSGTNGSSAASSLVNSSLSSLPGGFSYYAKYGDFDAVLEAVATDSRISVLSRPQIQTSHGVEAELFIGSTTPYVTGTQNSGYSGTSSTYTEKEVGIRLRVLPIINSDGMVTMDIDQEIEQLGANVVITGVGNVPTTTKRNAGAKVAVMSGDTIILGGFISASRSLDHSGVPWLMDIPLLGNLFKSSSANNSRTELIVLMRPTVLTNAQMAAKAAADQRNKMAAVKQAELDIRKDEDDRNAAANKALLKQEAKEARKAAGQPANLPAGLPPKTNIYIEMPPSTNIYIGTPPDTNAPADLPPGDPNSEPVIEKEKE